MRQFASIARVTPGRASTDELVLIARASMRQLVDLRADHSDDTNRLQAIRRLRGHAVISTHALPEIVRPCVVLAARRPTHENVRASLSLLIKTIHEILVPCGENT